LLGLLVVGVGYWAVGLVVGAVGCWGCWLLGLLV